MAESYRGFTVPEQGDPAPWGNAYNANAKATIDTALDLGTVDTYRHYAYVMGGSSANGSDSFLSVGMYFAQDSSWSRSGVDPYVPCIGLQDPSGSPFGCGFEPTGPGFSRTVISTAGPGFDISFELRELASLTTQTTLVCLGRRDGSLGGSDSTAQIASWGPYGMLGVGWDATNPTIGIYTNPADSGAPTRLVGAGTSAARTTDLLNIRFVCLAGEKDVTVIVKNVTTGAELINYKVLELNGLPIDLLLACAINTTQGTSGVQNPVALYKIIKKIPY